MTGLSKMEQLLAFCDWERKHRRPEYGSSHIAEWAAEEIERLGLALAAAQEEILRDGRKMNNESWRCFHCDETFTDPAEAELHFGPRIWSDPACRVDAGYLRELERRLERYREEDTDLHRQIAAMESSHRQALMQEEEAGYARGLRDARADGLVTPNAADHRPL